MAKKTGKMEVLKLGWDDIERMCGELAAAISSDGYSPEVIVGIGRGGWVPARLLSDLTGVSSLLSLRAKFYERAGKPGKTPVIIQHVPRREIAGKRVLVVDDVSDSGKSLRVVRKALSAAGEVRIATLHMKPGSVTKPDYFVGTTGKWILYPWEKKEVGRELGKNSPAKSFKQGTE